MKKKSLMLLLLLAFSFVSVLSISKVYAVTSISYSYPIITVVGFNSTIPCTFWDIWNASNVNGWAAVGKTSTSTGQFDTYVRLYMGDGSTPTYFADTNVNWFFNTTWDSAGDRIRVTNNANLTLGTLSDSVTRTTTEGVNIISGDHLGDLINVQTGGIGEIYGSHLTNKEGTGSIRNAGNLTIYESALTNLEIIITGTSNLDNYYNLIIEGSTNGIWNIASNPFTGSTFEEIYIDYTTNAIAFVGTSGAIFTDLKGRNNTNVFRGTVYSGITYIVDADVDSWTFAFIGPPLGGIIYRQYTFKINVTDSNGVPLENANVTLTDVDNIQEFSVLTGINGSFAYQTVTYGFYNQTGGNMPYLRTPHQLIITHDNYSALSHRVYINEWKTVFQVVLVEPSGFVSGIGSGFILAFMICTVLGLAGIYKIKKR